jgi:hypothetical protein
MRELATTWRKIRQGSPNLRLEVGSELAKRITLKQHCKNWERGVKVNEASTLAYAESCEVYA